MPSSFAVVLKDSYSSFGQFNVGEEREIERAVDGEAGTVSAFCGIDWDCLKGGLR